MTRVKRNDDDARPPGGAVDKQATFGGFYRGTRHAVPLAEQFPIPKHSQATMTMGKPIATRALHRRWLSALMSCALISVASAQEEAATPVEEVPVPPPIRSGETLEPDVTIVRTEEQVIYEYRVAGQLRAVKVVPSVGPAYYLTDADGDGRLESQRHEYAPRFWINSWRLFSW